MASNSDVSENKELNIQDTKLLDRAVTQWERGMIPCPEWGGYAMLEQGKGCVAEEQSKSTFYFDF